MGRDMNDAVARYLPSAISHLLPSRLLVKNIERPAPLPVEHWTPSIKLPIGSIFVEYFMTVPV